MLSKANSILKVVIHEVIIILVICNYKFKIFIDNVLFQKVKTADKVSLHIRKENLYSSY